MSISVKKKFSIYSKLNKKIQPNLYFIYYKKNKLRDLRNVKKPADQYLTL